MIQSTTGLILRTRPLTETSLIVNWLTPDLGRISTVAKGARRPRSAFAGQLDLFYAADFSFQRSRRSDLHTLHEIKLRETHPALRHELACLQQAAYCSKLIEQATEPETPLPAVYDLLEALLTHLPKQAPQPQTLFAFEIKLLHELGLAPDMSQSQLTPGTRRIVGAFSAGAWPAVARLKLSEAQVRELRNFLHSFLIFHLGRIPKVWA